MACRRVCPYAFLGFRLTKEGAFPKLVHAIAHYIKPWCNRKSARLNRLIFDEPVFPHRINRLAPQKPRLKV